MAIESEQLSIEPSYSLRAFVCYFLWLGTTGFGGPIALAGYMERDLVEQRRWLTKSEYLEGLALAQLAPGPLAAQLAIYLGYVREGILGATLISLAFIGPSFLMVLGLAAAYVRFGGLSWVQALFYGIGAAVIGIIARSVWKLVRLSVGRDFVHWGIFGVLAVSTALTQREIVVLFLAAGVVNMIAKTPPRWAVTTATHTFAITSAAVPLLIQILAFFAKAGLFVFGSGLAIVPFLHGGIVVQHHWLTERQFVDAVAVAMITPGPVVITVAFVGYLVAGTPGAIAAALGVFLPVYLVVVLIGPYYRKFADNARVRAFVRGVTAAAVGAIAGAIIVLGRRSIHDSATAAIAVITFLTLLKWKIPEPILIATAGALGLLLYRP